MLLTIVWQTCGNIFFVASFSTIDHLLGTTKRYRLDINVWYNIF